MSDRTHQLAAVLSGGVQREELQKAELLFDDAHHLMKGIEQLDDNFAR
ncbi:MAG TPA: hypothetical protein VMT00_14460 [Thermoanaerobaculia bacterium]|nr:hypothetical protein [Thermoanaerobaculia bacterium]